MDTTFHHIRIARRNKMGDLEPSSRGGITVCVLRTEDGPVFGIAACSPLDNYDKRKGRVISEGRARSKSEKLAHVRHRGRINLTDVAQLTRAWPGERASDLLWLTRTRDGWESVWPPDYFDWISNAAREGNLEQ